MRWGIVVFVFIISALALVIVGGFFIFLISTLLYSSTGAL